MNIGHFQIPVKFIGIGRDLERTTFKNNVRLSNVTFNETARTIGAEMFRNCPGIRNIQLSNSIATIDDYAFYGCSGMESLSLGSKGSRLTSIGDYAFSGCSSLSTVISPSPTPPDIQSTTFDETTEKSATLYVPTGSKIAYWLHQYWGNFYNIVETDDFEAVMGISKTNAAPQRKNNHVYTLSGQLVMVWDGAEPLNQRLPAGIYIVNGKKVIIK